eukprot:CAMPEP_0178826492 /NCGR_PEP_ID=MMETSP0746-20121128/6777_1 /TAXON_ID=913974 /ORGANISM="Nitzschia punctata, Strain CCMP561" /LENGTH=367 /DNA_ID=CAMNT_0020488313 /DNA_START=24 /DNA_END=1127 /DNA_ORIENTATION=+
MKISLCVFPSFVMTAWGFTPLSTPSHSVSALNAGTNFNEMIPLKKGSTCALITPFDPETGKIDFPGLENLLQWHLDAGTDNLCILGTTSEASVMSMEERKQVLATAVDMCKGTIPLLVGTGTINPESVQKMTQQAIDMGADASLLVTPYYVKPPQRALIQFFSKMADLGLPTILYNVPGRTACNIQDDTILELSSHPNIVGIKDATGDINRLRALQEGLQGENDDFLLYSGDDGTTKDFILAGGHGCISVTSNIVPHMMHDMVHAALEGDVAKATSLDNILRPLHSKLFVESNPIPCKWAAQRIGLIDSAYCRPPLSEMDPQFGPTVDQALNEVGFLGVNRLSSLQQQEIFPLASHSDVTLPKAERV